METTGFTEGRLDGSPEMDEASRTPRESAGSAPRGAAVRGNPVRGSESTAGTVDATGSRPESAGQPASGIALSAASTGHSLRCGLGSGTEQSGIGESRPLKKSSRQLAAGLDGTVPLTSALSAD